MSLRTTVASLFAFLATLTGASDSSARRIPTLTSDDD